MSRMSKSCNYIKDNIHEISGLGGLCHPDWEDEVERFASRLKEMIRISNEIMKKTCFDCCFYNTNESVCYYDCRVVAILDEEVATTECCHYREGEFNLEQLEKYNYL